MSTTDKLIQVPINKNNFLRFYDVDRTLENSVQANGLHNAYQLRWINHEDYLPILNGDTLVFYTNFDEPNQLDIDKLVVVIDKGKGEYELTEDVNLIAENWGQNNYRITLSVPTNSTLDRTKIRIALLGTEEFGGYEFIGVNSSTITGRIARVRRLSNGNLILVGSFEKSLGNDTANVAIIDQNGNLVPTIYSDFNNIINDVIELNDGILVFVGNFTNYSGFDVSRIVALNVFGTIESTINFGVGTNQEILTITKDSTNNLYIGGIVPFFFNNSSSGQRIWKILPNGVADTTFTPPTLSTTVLQIDNNGKLLAGRSGSGGISRLNLDGTLDTSFTSGFVGFAAVGTIAVAPDDSIFVLGNLGSGIASNIAKLLPDGGVDTSFPLLITSSLQNLIIENNTLIVTGNVLANIYTLGGELVQSFPVNGTVGNLRTLGENTFLTGIQGANFGFAGIGNRAYSTITEVFLPAPTLKISNLFVVVQRNLKNLNNTHLISVSTLSNIYNYEWSIFDESVDDRYTVRVLSSKVGVEYQKDSEIYKEATTGRPRVTRATVNKNISFEIYYGSEDLHDVISIFSSFRDFKINNDPYVCEEVEAAYERIHNLFKATLKLRDVNFSSRINKCIPNILS
jgi:hypothetical protein